MQHIKCKMFLLEFFEIADFTIELSDIYIEYVYNGKCGFFSHQMKYIGNIADYMSEF